MVALVTEAGKLGTGQKGVSEKSMRFVFSMFNCPAGVESQSVELSTGLGPRCASPVPEATAELLVSPGPVPRSINSRLTSVDEKMEPKAPSFLGHHIIFSIHSSPEGGSSIHPGYNVYGLSLVAVTAYHKFGGLGQHIFIILELWRSKV